MPGRYRKASKKSKKTTKPRRYRRRVPRTLGLQRTFTECLSAGPLPPNAGGVFKCKMTDIPQLAQYRQLYKQFCIKSFKVVLLPRWNSADQGLSGSYSDNMLVRTAFAINDTPDTVSPTTELDVLTSNGARVVMGSKKIQIRCVPKPDITVNDGLSSSQVALRTKAPIWLNFANGATAYNGESIEHGGISYWITGGLTANLNVYDVYYYITFSVRDAA